MSYGGSSLLRSPGFFSAHLITPNDMVGGLVNCHSAASCVTNVWNHINLLRGLNLVNSIDFFFFYYIACKSFDVLSIFKALKHLAYEIVNTNVSNWADKLITCSSYAVQPNTECCAVPSCELRYEQPGSGALFILYSNELKQLWIERT